MIPIRLQLCDLLQKSPPPERAGGHYPGSDAGSESSTTSSVPHGIGLKSADAVAVGDLVPVRACHLRVARAVVR